MRLNEELIGTVLKCQLHSIVPIVSVVPIVFELRDPLEIQKNPLDVDVDVGMSGMSVSDRARMKRAMPSTLFVTFAMKERSMNWMVRASASSELDTTIRHATAL